MKAATWVAIVGLLLAGCGPAPSPFGGAAEPAVDAAAGAPAWSFRGVVRSQDALSALLPGLAVGSTREAVLPRADLILTLRDGGVRFSAPITAGRRTLWVRNEGPHAHRALFARLAPGHSTDEARSWLARPHGRRGASPFHVLGGTVLLGLATDEIVTLDFAPGSYLLLCPLREADDGPGAAEGTVHGIMQAFRIE